MGKNILAKPSDSPETFMRPNNLAGMGLERHPCRPFVKWVGGKTQLIGEIFKRLPSNFTRYFEPFVGGGAVFFQLQHNQSFLSDVNHELVNAYKVVRDDVEKLISTLITYRYCPEYFYEIRNADRSIDYASWSTVEKAARLIYLNKTCFNGLYRVNSKGHFNVPFGRYTNPTICNAENLRTCSQALANVNIETCSFDRVVDYATTDDFIYFDPPYIPLNTTSYFTAYAQQGFNLEMQEHLRDVCKELDARGVKFLLSNSVAPLVFDLYENFIIERVGAIRAINSKAQGRGRIEEVLVRNYKI